ncbi:MAG TPA: peptidoglycan-binding protein [Actinomycetota bacterium]|jgi:N-acetylmuramoyl-L-alanine amidase|nr:peptidoglycan-binding protein [Actinomycetota bacterium]
MLSIRRGDRGEEVRDVQRRLLAAGTRIEPDELEGTFGASTEAAVRVFQELRGLPADGIVGTDTWGQLVEAGYRIGDRTLYLRSPAFRGDDVRELQRMLNALGFDAGKEDGIFGRMTTRGVMEFQRNVGEPADGIVGLDTVRSLERMRPTLGGPSRAMVREAEAARSMGAALPASVIAVDPGHGPSDPGVVVGGIVEAEIAWEVASRLVAELERRGARTIRLREEGSDPDAGRRAARANAGEATICVSIHLGTGQAVPAGVSCCHYGTPTTHSPMGRGLAGCILGELVRSLGLLDGGVRPLAIAILRETRMPAVQVELAVPSNPAEASLLTVPSFPDRAAIAIADGIERFLGAATEAPVSDAITA